jgi:hypothetical protein
MIRAAVLVGFLTLAACGSKQSSGPAWPKNAGRMEVDPEKDGGESLEPQQAVSIAAIEHSDDKTPAVDEDAIVVDAPAAKTPVPGGDAKPEGATKSPPAGDVKIEVIEVRPEDLILEP